MVFCQRLLEVITSAVRYGTLRCQNYTTQCRPFTESYKPRRALLYVPASDVKKVEKAAKMGADSVVIDCEDAVAVNMKTKARDNVHQMLNSNLEFGRSELGVRVNDVTTGLAEDDLSAVLTAKRQPDMINLPKIQIPEHLDLYYNLIRSRLRPAARPLSLTIMIETSLGFANMSQILNRGRELSDDKVRLEAAVFGYDDFSASIGCVRTPEITEMLGVRQLFVVYAKAFRLQALDAVFTDFKDAAGLEKQSLEAFGFGYTGKQIIHPNQVLTVHKCFTPSEERIEWARSLVAEFDQYQETGQGAFTFRGRMIDMPIYLQAKSIVDLLTSIESS